MLQFSEVPEIDVELVNTATIRRRSASARRPRGPTVAAIGNAVAHALGARIRDLPLTRERVMAALLRTSVRSAAADWSAPGKSRPVVKTAIVRKAARKALTMSACIARALRRRRSR